MTFDDAIERVLGHEGGYVNRADDPGGETNWGITWPILKQGIFDGIVPRDTTIKLLTRDQSKLLYRRHFWEEVNADVLFDGVAFQALDFAVHSGPGTSIRALQRALGVADDGRFGPHSRAAAKAMSESDQIQRLLAERIEFMSRLSNWSVASRGWARRIAGNLRYGSEDS